MEKIKTKPSKWLNWFIAVVLLAIALSAFAFVNLQNPNTPQIMEITVVPTYGP